MVRHGHRSTQARGIRFAIPYRGVWNLELDDEQAAALIRELDRIIQDDRYPLSPRICTLRDILGMLRPEPERQPVPLLKYYEPPKAVMRKRRRGRVGMPPNY
jgi:hypothetical protein